MFLRKLSRPPTHIFHVHTYLFLFFLRLPFSQLMVKRRKKTFDLLDSGIKGSNVNCWEILFSIGNKKLSCAILEPHFSFKEFIKMKAWSFFYPLLFLFTWRIIYYYKLSCCGITMNNFFSSFNPWYYVAHLANILWNSCFSKLKNKKSLLVICILFTYIINS